MRRSILLALSFVLLAALPARAIPVFARRYQTACTACHVQPPLLNSFGQAFRANGYRIPSGEQPRQDKDVQLGAPEWAELFPRTFLPGTVSDAPPFAGILYAALEGDRGRVNTESADAYVKVASAGNLGSRVSWFAAAGVGARGAGIERAWASFDRLGGTSWLGARVGYLEPAVVAFARSQNLAYEGYLAYNAAGPAGVSLSDSRPGIELFGAGADPGELRGLQYAAGLSSRNVPGGLAADAYARLSYKFGGIAPAGDQLGEPGRLSPAVAPLEERSLRLGAFVYQATVGGPDSRPRGVRGGADAQLLFGRFDLFATGWLGSDAVSSTADSSASWSLLTGAGFRPWPWLYFIGRYEGVGASGAVLRRAVATARVALQQNVALSADFLVELPHAPNTELVGSLFLAF